MHVNFGISLYKRLFSDSFLNGIKVWYCSIIKFNKQCIAGLWCMQLLGNPASQWWQCSHRSCTLILEKNNVNYQDESASSLHSVNDHTCCAERNLLQEQIKCANKHCVKPCKFGEWIRRKFGCHMTVWRTRGDGSFGCSTPCVLCRKELLRYNIYIHVMTVDNEWYHGRIAGADAPPSKPTNSQVKLYGFKPVTPINLRRHKHYIE